VALEKGNLLAPLSALSQFALSSPKQFAPQVDSLKDFVFEDLLLRAVLSLCLSVLSQLVTLFSSLSLALLAIEY
jgi:hypothetical protein